MCTPHGHPASIPVERLVTRRGFLRAGVAATLAGATASTLRAWPASAQVPPGAPGCVPAAGISLQLYTMRDVMASDLDGTFAALADIGFRTVEHAGFTGADDAASFKEALDAHGLHATSGHQGVPYPYDAAAWEATIEDALLLGQTRMVEPAPAIALGPLVLNQVGDAIAGTFGQPNPAHVTAPAALWADFAATLNEAGAAARDAGLRLGYHNHDPEFAPLADAPGKRGYDILLEETDPDLVHFELDLYWAWAGETDPVELLEAHPTRFQQFHVKDMAPDGSITFPGTGIIDFDRIFVRAAELDVPIEEWIIEQDNAGQDAVETARLGFELLTATCAAAPTPTPAPPSGGGDQDVDDLPATGGGLAGMAAMGLAGALALRTRHRTESS